MSESLISILLPVRNAAKYLHKCIESIIVQTEINWELIAIEDHSEDNSFDILKKYESSDPRIQVFKNNGKGIIPALRLAFSKSKGALITRMDADDIMMPLKLEKLKTLLLSYGPGHLTTGLVEYFSEEVLGNGYLKYQNWLNELSIRENNYSNIYKECVIPSPCWMVFRDDLNRCGAFNLDTYPEDYDLCFRFYKNNLIVKSVPEILHRWRDYAERTSRNDPNYADIHFFDLKINHFLEIDHQANKQLIIWGTGKKGKKLAKILLKNNIMFGWVTNNPKKIGKDIYGIKIGSSYNLKNLVLFQVIIAVAAKEAIEEIYKALETNYLGKSENFYLFC